MKNNKFWSTVKIFNTKSIFFKYITISVSTLIVPLIIFSIIFIAYSNYTLENEHRLYETTVNQKISETFDGIISSVYDTHISLDENVYSNIYFNLTEYSGLIENDLSFYLENLFVDKLVSNHNINSIYLYNKAINYVKGSNQSNFLNKLLDYGWYSEKTPEKFNNYIIHRSIKNLSRADDYITIYKNVYVKDKYLGSYIFNIPFSVVNTSLNFDSNIEKILITDNNNNIIYTNIPELLSGNYNYALSSYIKEITHTESKYNFNIYSSVSKTQYKERFILYTVLILILFFLFLLCALLTSYISSKKFYKSIVNIIGILQQNEAEVYDSKKENEYDFIRKSVLNITDKNKSTEQELAEKLSLLKTYHIKALHAQISPHFLNNTLNLIGLLDVKESKKQTELYKLINLFSKLLKELNNTNEYIVPLKQELQYAKDYLEIQNIKLRNVFDVKINADKDVLNKCVAKFILQPIIENAIIHGILSSESEQGTIIIEAYKSEDFLIVCVKNTNNTIECSTLERLRASLKENAEPESSHIGLLNVNQRLKLIFGTQSSCDIDCNYQENTTSTTLTIPLQEFNL